MRTCDKWPRKPDSLIAAQMRAASCRRSAAIARRACSTSGSPGDDAYERALADFDFWLRADGHRRNPGTTADLIAAGLFVLLREGRVELKR